MLESTEIKSEVLGEDASLAIDIAAPIVMQDINQLSKELEVPWEKGVFETVDDGSKGLIALILKLAYRLVPQGIDIYLRFTPGRPEKPGVVKEDYSAFIGDGRTPFKKMVDDKILVKKLDCEEYTLAGLKLPENMKEKPSQGLIVMIGPGSLNEKTGELEVPEFEVGEKILFGKFAGTDVKVHGVEYKVLTPKDVLAVF